MSSKVNLNSVRIPTASSPSDVLTGISNRIATEEAANKRLEAQLVRQRFLDDRYNAEKAQAEADKLAAIQLQSDMLTPTNMNFTTKELVNNPDDLLRTEYDDVALNKNAANVPVIDALNLQKISDKDKMLANDISSITNMKDISDVEKDMAIRNYMQSNNMSEIEEEDGFVKKGLKLAGRLAMRPMEYADLMSDTIVSPFLSPAQNDQEYLDRKKDSENIDKDFKIDDPIGDLKKKVSGITDKQKSNKVLQDNYDKQIAGQQAFLEKYKTKKVYGKHKVDKPVTLAEGQKITSKYVKDEIAKLPKNLTPIQLARKKLAIKTRADNDYQKLVKNKETADLIRSEIRKENRDIQGKVAIKGYEHENKMIQIAEKARLANKITKEELDFVKSKTNLNTAKYKEIMAKIN